MAAGSNGDADRKRAFGKLISNWLLGDLSKLLNAEGLEITDTKVQPEQLAALVSQIEAGKVSGTAAKEVLTLMFADGRDPDEIIAERGLGTIEDKGIVGEAIKKVLAANEKAITDYRAGKLEAVKFLVGQVMRETRGRANATEVQALLQSELDRAG